MILDIIAHYDKSKSRYDIEGESHLDYYRDKHPENYYQLQKYYHENIQSNNNGR